jgi:phosphotransacetylase
MIKDLILVIRVIKIKRKLKKIEKRIDKINDIMCKSNHTIDQMIELLEEHNDL